MDCFWTEEEWKSLSRVQTLTHLTAIALSVLRRMKALEKPIVQICGPMTTGGLGNYEANMVRFNKAIAKAQEKSSYLIFNQVLYTEPIIRIDSVRTTRGYWIELIDEFYAPIFRSGHFHGTLWLPDWQSSKGAIREREVAIECGLMMEDYPLERLDD
jgi:hypothetical protein